MTNPSESFDASSLIEVFGPVVVDCAFGDQAETLQSTEGTPCRLIGAVWNSH